MTPWTIACQAPLSMGFSRQEYKSGKVSSSSSLIFRINNPKQPQINQVREGALPPGSCDLAGGCFPPLCPGLEQNKSAGVVIQEWR